MSVPPKQAKLDLMQLGIELDDRLIERLQKNLGIDKIFQVARDVSHIIKTKPKLTPGLPAEMSYRYVSADEDPQTKQVAAKSVNPFQKELFQLDSKQSVSILRSLEDRNIEIEPQHRPPIDRMLDSFQQQYARSPERFVGRLLGQKWTLSERKNPDLIARAVLQNRYISREEFKVMMQRVVPDAAKHHTADDAVLNSLFKLLSEDKQFAASKNRAVVDLWSFLTLVKAATEESRRSYDGKTSQLATSVDFWRHSNNVIVDTPRDDGSVASSSTARAQSAPRMRAVHPRPANVNAKSVAEILGQQEFAHVSTEDKGRRVKGVFQQELNRAGSVSAAMGSTRCNSPPSPVRDHMWWVKESTIPVAAPDNMLDSSKVAYLLGKEERRSVSRGRSSVHCMRNEWNVSTVAEALGNAPGSKKHVPTDLAPRSPRKEVVAATGGKIGNRHPVSALEEFGGADHAYVFDKLQRSRAHDKRKKFRSNEQLHWGDRPSVASALHPYG